MELLQLLSNVFTAISKTHQVLCSSRSHASAAPAIHPHDCCTSLHGAGNGRGSSRAGPGGGQADVLPAHREIQVCHGPVRTSSYAGQQQTDQPGTDILYHGMTQSDLYAAPHGQQQHCLQLQHRCQRSAITPAWAVLAVPSFSLPAPLCTPQGVPTPGAGSRRAQHHHHHPQVGAAAGAAAGEARLCGLLPQLPRRE